MTDKTTADDNQGESVGDASETSTTNPITVVGKIPWGLSADYSLVCTDKQVIENLSAITTEGTAEWLLEVSPRYADWIYYYEYIPGIALFSNSSLTLNERGLALMREAWYTFLAIVCEVEDEGKGFWKVINEVDFDSQPKDYKPRYLED
tara:strand:- start:16 stop:462 length:447 start_codon:yes stop_codon:yes gene_type:complete